MRFYLFDRIDEAERGKRITAVKAVTVMDAYFGHHYRHRAVMPATMLIEMLAQLGGFLNELNHDFRVRMVLMLVDGVRIHRQVRPGDRLELEVLMMYDHPYGATMRGEATVDGASVITAERIVYAHEKVDDPIHIRDHRARFNYQSGGYLEREGSAHG